MVNFWRRLASWRKVVLLAYVPIIIGFVIYFAVEDTPEWLLYTAIFGSCALTIVNFVLTYREQLRTPVEGRPDLDKHAP